MKKIIGIVLLLTLTLCSCSFLQKGTKIVFPGAAESQINVENMEYDLESLQKSVDEQTSKNKYYVYYNPKKVDYSIAKRFGFGEHAYSENTKGDVYERFYNGMGETASESAFLKIDEYGCFTLKTGIKETTFEMPFTPQECCSFAKEFLKKNDLLKETVSDNWSVNEQSLSDENVSKVHQLGINIFREIDGIEVIGNSRITVYVNGNGEIVNVYYNWREYLDSATVKLISVKKAISKIKEKEASISLEENPISMRIDNVAISYYEQARNEKNQMIQPVYIFSGVAETTEGEKEFYAIVQANA